MHAPCIIGSREAPYKCAAIMCRAGCTRSSCRLPQRAQRLRRFPSMDPNPAGTEEGPGGSVPVTAVRSSRTFTIAALLASVAIVGFLAYWLPRGSSVVAPPALITRVDSLRETPIGIINARLTLMNASDLPEWAGGCTIPVVDRSGERVIGEVRGVTLIPPGGAEPLQGMVVGDDGRPVRAATGANLIATAPVSCVSSPNKRDVVSPGTSP